MKLAKDDPGQGYWLQIGPLVIHFGWFWLCCVHWNNKQTRCKKENKHGKNYQQR